MVDLDKRRRQYFPLAVTWAHGTTGSKLKQRFGRDGLLVWVCYLTACKTNWVQGQMTYSGEPDGWSKLGLYGVEPEFTLDQFFTYTGQLKQTRKRRSGDVKDIVCTRWEDWNKEVDRERDADRKASKRAQNTPDKAQTLAGTEVEVEVEEEEEVDAPADMADTDGDRPRLKAVAPRWQKPTADDIQRVREMIPPSLRKGA